MCVLIYIYVCFDGFNPTEYNVGRDRYIQVQKGDEVELKEECDDGWAYDASTTTTRPLKRKSNHQICIQPDVPRPRHLHPPQVPLVVQVRAGQRRRQRKVLEVHRDGPCLPPC